MQKFDYTVICVVKGRDHVNSAFGGYMDDLHENIGGMTVGLAMSNLGGFGWKNTCQWEDEKCRYIMMEKVIEQKPTLVVKFITHMGIVVEAFEMPRHLIPEAVGKEETWLRNQLIYWGFTEDSIREDGTTRTFFYSTIASGVQK